jgi:hypothetical protein
MSTTFTTKNVGAIMPDGTVYAGISPGTGKPMYAAPKDAPLTMTFDQAANYAKDLDANGRRDWRVPSKAELNELFQNRAAIGGFDETGHVDTGWYWSSSRYDFSSAWAQRFSDGIQNNDGRGFRSALRCVRDLDYSLDTVMRLRRMSNSIIQAFRASRPQ